jgi:hypothetical protein
MTPTIAQAIAVTLEARAHQLWEQEVRDRRWMRADWTPARHNRVMLLRELLAIRRTARRLARETVERQDPLTAAKAYADLGYHAAQAAYEPAAGPITEAELWGGYGASRIAGESPDLNRECEPTW